MEVRTRDVKIYERGTVKSNILSAVGIAIKLLSYVASVAYVASPFMIIARVLAVVTAGASVPLTVRVIGLVVA